MKLPNLNALRTFECVARHQSFTLAARDLGVTQSSVSKQIAGLEEHFGQPLFVRHHRRIELTEFGKEVSAAAYSGLQHIVERLTAIDRNRPNQIRLLADADFVQLWLFPKLAEFESRFPAIRISIHCTISMNAPPEGDYDCAIFWGRGEWRNCRFEPLLRNTVFPVAAPGFFADLGRKPKMSDITNEMLIHDQTTSWWAAFRSAAGVTEFEPEAGRIYNQSVLCLEAATRGDGITIGDEVTSRDYLASGKLICPFAETLPSPDAYYIVQPEGRKTDDDLAAFIGWLRARAAAHDQWFSEFWARRAKETSPGP